MAEAHTSVIIYRQVHGFQRQMGHFSIDMSNRVEHEKRNQTATSQWSVGFVFFCSTGFSLSIEVSPLEYDVFSECALRCPGYFLYKTTATSHAVEDSTYVTGYQFAIYHNIKYSFQIDIII